MEGLKTFKKGIQITNPKKNHILDSIYQEYCLKRNGAFVRPDPEVYGALFVDLGFF